MKQRDPSETLNEFKRLASTEMIHAWVVLRHHMVCRGRTMLKRKYGSLIRAWRRALCQSAFLGSLEMLYAEFRVLACLPAQETP